METNQDKFDNVGERVAFVLKCLKKETLNSLSHKLGVNRNTILSYKKGMGDLKGIVIENLVLKFNINPNWLLLGKGPIYIKDGSYSETNSTEEIDNVPLNYQLLQEIISGVESWLDDRALELDPDAKAELICLLYDQFSSDSGRYDSGTLERFMRLGTR